MVNGNPQREQWEAHETRSLSERCCPYSGLPLQPHSWITPGDSLSCAVCDCFGYDPDDERIGAA